MSETYKHTRPLYPVRARCTSKEDLSHSLFEERGQSYQLCLRLKSHPCLAPIPPLSFFLICICFLNHFSQNVEWTDVTIPFYVKATGIILYEKSKLSFYLQELNENYHFLVAMVFFLSANKLSDSPCNSSLQTSLGNSQPMFLAKQHCVLCFRKAAL